MFGFGGSTFSLRNNAAAQSTPQSSPAAQNTTGGLGSIISFGQTPITTPSLFGSTQTAKTPPGSTQSSTSGFRLGPTCSAERPSLFGGGLGSPPPPASQNVHPPFGGFGNKTTPDSPVRATSTANPVAQTTTINPNPQTTISITTTRDRQDEMLALLRDIRDELIRQKRA